LFDKQGPGSKNILLAFQSSAVLQSVIE